MVRYLDMRLFMVVLINTVLKPPQFQTGGGVSWKVMTWTNLLTFVLFSFVTIEVPLTLTIFTTCSFHIRLRFGNRPLFAAVAFMASLTSPRLLFWCGYPVILLLLFFLPTHNRLVQHALSPLQAVIPINISISAALGGINEPHQQQQQQQQGDEQNSETPDVESSIELADQ